MHFLQIWILPDVTGIAPEYEERRFAAAEKRGRLRLIASLKLTAASTLQLAGGSDAEVLVFNLPGGPD